MHALAIRMGGLPASTQIQTDADDVLTGVTFPFSFVIDGVSYTTAKVSSNGWLEFGSTGTDSRPFNGNLPSSAFTGPMVAAFWDDLVNVQTQANSVGTAPNRVYSIQWYGERFGTPGVPVPDSVVYFVVKLYEGSNVIGVYYDTAYDASLGGTATIGYQLAGGVSAKTYPLSFNANVLAYDAGITLGQGWSISPVR